MLKKVIRFPARSTDSGLSERRRAQFAAIGLICDPRISVEDIEEMIEFLTAVIDSKHAVKPHRCEVVRIKK